MAESVKLIGLDFGSTTSSAVVAEAELSRTAIGGTSMRIREERFRSEMVFTPMLADRIDIQKVERLLDQWLEAGGVRPEDTFGGGALLTGLTARRENAVGLVELIRRRLGDALIATADDPCLESWLSFMGNCAGLSQEHPGRLILNLDIGGGTTNIALGRDRQVLRTGCLFVGARHIQVLPGTHQLEKLSAEAAGLLEFLRIEKAVGDVLAKAELESVLDYQLLLLEAVCTGQSEPLETPLAKQLVQIPFHLDASNEKPLITFSGGVGELIYRHLEGSPWPGTTQFGDLGIDLARRIVSSPVWSESLQRIRPKSAGRATVHGLLRHATEVSGNTLFLGNPGMLPLSDIPVLGSIRNDSTQAELRDALRLVRQSGRGGCLQVRLGGQETAAIREMAGRLSELLHEMAFPADHPLVFLLRENAGKVFGQYVTRWGALPLSVFVIDEVPLRDAHYVRIGLPRNQVVPVSYHGFLPHGDLS